VDTDTGVIDRLELRWCRVDAVGQSASFC